MYKRHLLIFLLLPLFNAFAQNKHEFKKSDKYYLTEIDSTVANNYWINKTNKTEPILRYLKEKSGKTIAQYDISILEFYENSIIEVLKINNMKNITEVIRLTNNYSSGCWSTEIVYYLKTKNGQLIKMPELEYGNCDNLGERKEYLFSNQNCGIPNQILLVNSEFRDLKEKDKPEILKTFYWNGKNI